MKTQSLLTLFLLLLPLVSPLQAAGDEMIGSVKTFQAPAFVVRDQNRIRADLGLKLYEGDILRTESRGSLGVILRDDTVIAVGPDSEIVLESFQFAPAEGKLSIWTRMTYGTISYLSGQIRKLAPDAVRFSTPVATVGIRGTRFLAKINAE